MLSQTRSNNSKTMTRGTKSEKNTRQVTDNDLLSFKEVKECFSQLTDNIKTIKDFIEKYKLVIGEHYRKEGKTYFFERDHLDKLYYYKFEEARLKLENLKGEKKRIENNVQKYSKKEEECSKEEQECYKKKNEWYRLGDECYRQGDECYKQGKEWSRQKIENKKQGQREKKEKEKIDKKYQNQEVYMHGYNLRSKKTNEINRKC